MPRSIGLNPAATKQIGLEKVGLRWRWQLFQNGFVFREGWARSRDGAKAKAEARLQEGNEATIENAG